MKAKKFEIPTRSQFLNHLNQIDDLDFARFLYWQQISDTFMAVTQFESSIGMALNMADQIALTKRFGRDDSEEILVLARLKHINSSTTGSIIKILERHGFQKSRISYLNCVKKRRDYFIHRHFSQTPWPGDCDLYACEAMIRRLKAIEICLDRGSNKVWQIFAEEGLLKIHDLGSDGALISNITYGCNAEEQIT